MGTNSAEYDRAYYSRMSPEKLRRKLDLQLQRKAAVRAFVRDYKVTRGCVDCGERNPLVLDLDHRDPAQKVLAVSDLVNRGVGLETVAAELDKCDVRCANCHRIRTHTQRCIGCEQCLYLDSERKSTVDS